MDRLTDDLIQEVRRRANDDLPRIVGRHVQLKRRGREFAGLCPFHNEKSPSFTVVPRQGFFHCFGCGANGDAIKFTQRILGLDFPGAVRELARELGVAALEPGLTAEERARRVAERAAADARAEQDRQAVEAAERGREIEKAARIWRAAGEGGGSSLETYLRARAITIAPPVTLRFDPALPYWHTLPGERRATQLGCWPAMIGYVQDVERHFVAAHLTYLQPDLGGKAAIQCPRTGDRLPAKKMRGAAWGGAIRFTPPAPTLVLGEGIETVLSVMQAMAVDSAAGLDATIPSGSSCGPDSSWPAASNCSPSGERRTEAQRDRLLPAEGRQTGAIVAESLASKNLCFWAGLSLGNLAGGGVGRGAEHPTRRTREGRPMFLPSTRPDPGRPGLVLPAWCTKVVLLADSDNGDPLAAEALLQCAANRFRLQRRQVLIARAPEGSDFNDVLRGAA